MKKFALNEEAAMFRQISKSMPELIKLSGIPVTEIAKHTDLTTHQLHDRGTRTRIFNSTEILQILKVLIKLNNYLDIEKLQHDSANYQKLMDELPVIIDLTNAHQAEVQKKAGVSPGHYHQLVRKQRTLSPEKAISLLRAINEIQNYRARKNELENG